MIKYLQLLLLLIGTTTYATDNLELGTPSKNGQIVDREGYALCYSEKHEQPLWVSYKLTKNEVLTKVAKRRNNFRADPSITTGSSSLADYKGSGYDRGHLAPAADMAWSKKAMSDSFYLSNMSPQRAGLNRGMWKRLESYVRNWAIKRDEINIITGPIIRPNFRTIGANKVTVPQWYYKIIVDVKKSQAIAFMIPNRKPQKDISKFAVTIDKLEKITGLDFLDKLEDTKEEKIESQINLKLWTFSSKKTHKSSTKKLKPKTFRNSTVTKVDQAGGENYWITESSSKRHNKKCRYYSAC